MEAEKIANSLTLEKAALLGLIHKIISELPKKRQEHYYNSLAKNPFISHMDWCDELPFNLSGQPLPHHRGI